MFNTCLLCIALCILRPVYLLPNEVPDDGQADGYIPCKEGWSYFGGKCYKMFGGNMQAFGRLNWQEARMACESIGGHLVTIPSKEVQDFIFVFVSLVGEMEAWIGLNDLRNESQYEWLDGTEFNYTNWNELEPSGFSQGNEDCVQMALQVFRGEPGKWIDLDCQYPLAYICQTDQSKQNEKTRDPTKCSSEEGGGWKYGDTCYNVVNDSMTWDSAEKYCQDKYKGHLLTILNFKMDYFLNYITRDFNTEMWIGVKMRDKLQQKFSSGWAVVHSHWSKNPRNFVNGTCVVQRTGKTWDIVPCSQDHPFVCETSKVGPPVSEISFEESKCPDLPNDWRDLGGDYCYYIDTTKKVSWYEANFQCNRRGGTLASFHSKNEIDALAPYVKNALWQNYGIFIGHCRRLGYKNDVFVWADGSEMDFKYWSEGEPSNAEEQCGEVFAANMKWNDVRCGENKGYICSVKKTSTKLTEVEAFDQCISGATFRAWTGVCAGILLLVIVLAVVIYFFGPCKEEKEKKPSVIGVPPQMSIQSNRSQMHNFDGCNRQIVINEEEDGYEFME